VTDPVEGLLPLRGERVLLRDWRVDDVPRYRQWLRPHHDWHQWDGPYFPRPTETQADQACAGLVASIEAADRPTPRQRLVIADPGSDVLVGQVSWYYESEVSDWRRVGIVLYDPASWSGGRGTDALRLWTSYLFATTEVVRLDFATWSGNVGMCRIGQKLGWTEEARFRRARQVRGRRYDSVVYGVLREEWCTRDA
jgi:RimJ/RimL family protein N-acetyltransferase